MPRVKPENLVVGNSILVEDPSYRMMLCNPPAPPIYKTIDKVVKINGPNVLYDIYTERLFESQEIWISPDT